MVDTLICYTCPKDKSDVWLNALLKAFYIDKNPQAIGIPFYREYDSKTDLFFCPMVIPFMSSVVTPIVWKGFKSSADKDKIKLVRIKATKDLKEEYNKYVKESL